MDSQKTVNKNTLNVVKDLLAMGIFRCERKILVEVCKEMGENNAANLLEKTSDKELQDLHKSLTSVSHSPANLIVMYAGPGAGKSTITNYLFKRIPLKWLVVLATRDIRISEGESVGNPFSKYNMKWEEFDRIPDDDPNYIKTILRIDSAKQTQAKYDTVLKSRNVSFFKYIVDNSGELSKAQKDVEAVVIADRYTRLAKEYKKFPEYFKKIISRSQALKLKKWKGHL